MLTAAIMAEILNTINDGFIDALEDKIGVKSTEWGKLNPKQLCGYIVRAYLDIVYNKNKFEVICDRDDDRLTHS